MRDLTPSKVRHNDVTNPQHEIDKAEAAERRKVRHVPAGYMEVPAIKRCAGNGVIQGVFKSPSKGFCILMKNDSARIVTGEEYVRTTTARSKSVASRRLKRRILDDDGNYLRTDYPRIRTGLSTMLITIPPWACRTVESIGSSERQALLLSLAEVVAAEGKRISKRPMHSAGIHTDTAVPHFHTDWEKSDKSGFIYEKKTFKTCGPSLCHTDRIDRAFPELLPQWQRSRMYRHLDRKDVQHLIDLQLTRRLDAELEAWIRDRGLWANYQKEKTAYRNSKSKEIKNRSGQALVGLSLEEFAQTRVWPLAFRAMSHAMWRAVPSELRTPIMLSIRAAQFVARPTLRGALTIGKGLFDPAKEIHPLEKSPPLRTN